MKMFYMKWANYYNPCNNHLQYIQFTYSLIYVCVLLNLWSSLAIRYEHRCCNNTLYSMSVSNVADLMGSGVRSQSACSSPQGLGSGGVGASMILLEETLNICRMTQSMIDIAAKQLFGLRRCRTSEDLIQKEICECEVCANKCTVTYLIKMSTIVE